MVTVQSGFAGTSAGVAERENSNPVFPAQAGNIGNYTTAAAAAAVTAAVI